MLEELHLAVSSLTRTEWWLNKINKNKIQDKNAEVALQELGWKIVNIWECSLKGSQLMPTLEKLLSDLH